MYLSIPSASYSLQAWEKAISILSFPFTHILHSGLSVISDVVTKSWPTWGSSAHWLTPCSSSDKLGLCWAGRMSCQCQVRISIVWKTAETITMLAPISGSPQPSAHCIFYGFRVDKEDSTMHWLEEALLTERRRDGVRSICEFWLPTQGKGTHYPSCAASEDLFTLGRECGLIGGLVYTTNV